ncbi:MAG: 50S ribosomal protein L29 [Candidatus Mcinerneyibacterium aminivorans]|jgi:large subunit ribosomal protein L29|uniref:Large ribosomal subunit protein uL29 n=1 Tax=Candidatus Mcinerneyibacterium aminivorans TaxID=2703815 RepID=A0A5D0MC83_9BACT|nr:MAG: 50S ribosomal protein L29 [Candidatus Mcinerneyibacterium aminivorans]
MKLTAKELREFTDKELEQKLYELKEELFNLNFRKVTSHLEDTSVIKKTKKNIARVLTVMRERELEEVNSEKE